jgi:Spy/CpxP family protein refolding chaperone
MIRLTVLLLVLMAVHAAAAKDGAGPPDAGQTQSGQSRAGASTSGKPQASQSDSIHSHMARHYAGRHRRAVASLSPDDLAALGSGEGWGLAKPAEFNGYPGPAHVLELADSLEITPGQRARVESIFRGMRASAVEAGKRYIAAESHLDDVFRSSKATDEAVARAVAQAAQWRGELRLIHLRAHLETAKVLSGEQRRRYAHLRGYGGEAAGADRPDHSRDQDHDGAVKAHPK